MDKKKNDMCILAIWKKKMICAHFFFEIVRNASCMGAYIKKYIPHDFKRSFRPKWPIFFFRVTPFAIGVKGASLRVKMVKIDQNGGQPLHTPHNLCKKRFFQNSKSGRFTVWWVEHSSRAIFWWFDGFRHFLALWSNFLRFSSILPSFGLEP